MEVTGMSVESVKTPGWMGSVIVTMPVEVGVVLMMPVSVAVAVESPEVRVGGSWEEMSDADADGTAVDSDAKDDSDVKVSLSLKAKDDDSEEEASSRTMCVRRLNGRYGEAHADANIDEYTTSTTNALVKCD